MSKDFQIDRRSVGDIIDKLGELAASYTPEWGFDPANPDIGAVIALIFARQMEGTIGRLNQALGKYRTEFVNMLGLPLLPARAALGVAVVKLMGDTTPGIRLPRGSRFLGSGAADSSIVFETLEDVFVTNARLTDILQISPAKGRIIAVTGSAQTAGLFGNAGQEPPEPGVEPEPEPPPVDAPGFTLFDFNEAGIERNALIMYHRELFDAPEGAEIYIRARAAVTGEDLSGYLSDPAHYRWSYMSEEGLKPFDHVRAGHGAVALKRGAACGKVRGGDGELYSAVMLEAAVPPRGPLELAVLEMASAGQAVTADFVSHNAADLGTGDFMPFGETASLFDECYIGQDVLFAQSGATLTMQFKLSYREKLATFTPQQEQDNLKIIKRKPRAVLFETVRTAVERVDAEYFNGVGWRRLPFDIDIANIFDGGNTGDISLSFNCPDDWKPLTIGGYSGRCLRLRVAQADNCYLQPCIHKMPLICGLMLSYSYRGQWKPPHRLTRVRGTAEEDLTAYAREGRLFTAFAPLPYARNGLYLGFNRKITGSPVSILFNIEPGVVSQAAPIAFEYSQTNGFAPLKVIDHTRSLTGAGVVMFAAPPDFSELTVEGVRRYWLRAVDAEDAYNEPGRACPVIRDISVNAVEIHNVETMAEESFYLDAARPNMSIALNAKNILSADVFVNEMGMHPLAAMRRMAAENPQDVRVAYDFLGEINEFFVRWSEVDSFDTSKPGDRHYMIDRMNSRILFGDGISVMAPRAQNGEAFTVTARCTRGAAGNLPAGAVNAAQGHLMHVDSIINPVDIWGGSDIESPEKAHERCANVLRSQNRLISVTDLCSEIKGYSSNVAKVRVMPGREPDGRKSDGVITVAVMTDDYKNGAYSFSRLRDGLKSALLEKCEAALRGEQLIIIEPTFVAVSVTVFAESREAPFTVRGMITEALDGFLDPLGHSNNWDIGVLPGEEQIRLLLDSLRFPGAIRGFTATARWTDKRGVHERALCSMACEPFMLVINGEHTVYLEEVARYA